MWFVRSLLVWLIIVVAESIHGTLRELLLAPLLSNFRVRQVAVFTASLIIFAVTYALIRWIRAKGISRLLAIGIAWVVLTEAFEIGLGRYVLDYSWERVMSDLDIFHGGLMPIGLLLMLFNPAIAAKMRGVN